MLILALSATLRATLIVIQMAIAWGAVIQMDIRLLGKMKYQVLSNLQ